MGRRPSSNPDGNFGAAHVTHGGQSKVEVFVRWGELTGPLADQADLWLALDGLAPKGHTHTWASITNRATSLQGYGIEDAVSLPDFNSFQTANTAALATKLSADALTAGLATKASITDLTNGLAGKASLTALSDGLATKADLAHGHVIADVTGLQGALDSLTTSVAGKAATAHTHVIADVTGLQGAIDAKMSITGGTFTSDILVPDEAYGVSWNASSEVPTKNAIYDKIEALALGVVSDWGDIGGTLSNQTDLQTVLNTKADKSGGTFTGDIIVPDEIYSPSWDGNLEVPTKNAVYDKIQALIVGGGATLSDGDYGDILVGGTGSTMTVQTIGGVVPSMPGHTHAIADVTGLQTALNAKAATAHTHVIGDTTGLQAALDAKAATTHSHIIADVTGLQGALDGKALAVHNHDSAYAAIGHNHDGVYAVVAHNHDAAYAPLAHNHNGIYALVGHTHAIADVTGLQAELDSKAGPSALNGKADAYMKFATNSSNVTLSDNNHNNGVLTMTGASSRTITANATPTAGFSCVIHNLGSVSMTLSAASGVYKNGSVTSATTGSIASGGVVTVIHKGSGVWIAKGDIT